MKELQVSAIQSGTVIDHIESARTFQVAQILKVEREEGIVLVGTNLGSKALGKKGIIKISGKNLTQQEVNKIALIAPDATVNIIEDYEVVKKFKVRIPDVIEGIMKCFNPNCVTNHQSLPTRFHVAQRSPLKLRCHHCERTLGLKDVVLS
jgi:aspartate carbamoyltransferase regulatory subunit